MALNYSEQKQIAERYARAGFALAVDAKKVPAVAEALQALKAAYLESDDLRRVVKSPMVSAEELKAAFDAIAKKLKADAIVGQMLHRLIDNGRAALLPALADAFLAKSDAAESVPRVEVTSAEELDKKTLKEITDALGGDKVAISTKIDPTLIGGLILRQGSRMLDASVSGRLARLKQTLQHTRIETA